MILLNCKNVKFKLFWWPELKLKSSTWVDAVQLMQVENDLKVEAAPSASASFVQPILSFFSSNPFCHSSTTSSPSNDPAKTFHFNIFQKLEIFDNFETKKKKRFLMEVVIFEGKAFQARYLEHKVVQRVLTCFFP